MDPLERKPLIFEPEVPVYTRFIACQEPKGRQAVPNVDPDFIALRGDVLRLRP